MGKNRKARKQPIFRLCVFVFTCYVVGCLINLQIDITNKKKELELVAGQIEVQRIANKKLERLLESGEDKDYIERIAREKLGFAYPDERVYIDISGD